MSNTSQSKDTRHEILGVMFIHRFGKSRLTVAELEAALEIFDLGLDSCLSPMQKRSEMLSILNRLPDRKLKHSRPNCMVRVSPSTMED